MQMDEKNVYYGKTAEDAIEAALAELQITKEEAEITVLDEGKKRLIGGAKAKVKVVKKQSDGEKAVSFIEGLMEILNLNVVTELVSDGDKVEIVLTSTESNKVIGRHGEVLDSVQTLAGAVANIGRDRYKKVVVDCENYRSGREQTLTELAQRLAKKAVEKRRRVALEPMNPYERRIIHSALTDSEEVKTISSGKEPARFVVIVPDNEIEGSRPYTVRSNRDRDGRGRDTRRDSRSRGGRERDRGQRSGAPRSGAPRGKKEIHFGTFLGNSGNTHDDEE